MKPESHAGETIYSGRIFDIRIDQFREGEKQYNREIVVHKGGAVIVPVFDDGTVALVRQFRHAVGEYLLEIPAGMLDDGEDPMVGAVRELEEEIGVRAAHIQKLTELYASPGYLTEKMHIFMATGLTEVGQNLDEEEDITIEQYSFDQLFEMIKAGRLPDAKTIVGITLAHHLFSEAGPSQSENNFSADARR